MTSATAASNNDPGPMMYIPQAQVPDAANALNVALTPISWVVRTQVEPRSVSTAVQEQLRQASGLPVSNVRTMSEVVSRSTSRQTLQHVADDGLRRLRAPARGHRHLRTDGLLGPAADAGNRHPARARRPGASGEEHGRQAGDGADARRRRRRPLGRVSAVEVRRQLPLRRSGEGSRWSLSWCRSC